MSEVWVARQPIFDKALATYGYELLFRSPGKTSADVEDRDSATAQVLVGTLADIGLDRLVGSTRAFVNLTREYLVGRLPIPVPPERVVLEILEDIVADKEVVDGVLALKRQGFLLALDDFVQVRRENEPLLRHVDLIKVECLKRKPEEIAATVQSLKPYGVKLLAEKIETQPELEACQGLGFHYYQGYFLERPQIVKAVTLSPQRLQLMRLVAELQSQSLSFERIDELLRSDVALSYKLMSCVNSVSLGLSRRVDSVREALVYLGLNYVRNLVSLLLLTRLDDKPIELVTTAMTRSRMCEFLAQKLKRGDPRAAFTVGMFSLLDAFFDQPMDQIVRQLPLGPEVLEALTTRKGELGTLLTATIAYERGQWDQVEKTLSVTAPLQEAFLSAVSWVDGIQTAIRGAAKA